MYSYPKRDLYHQRTHQSEVTPAFEDSGLFKTALCDMMLELIPQTRHNEREDLIVRGFVDRKTEIDIFFAGRRTAETGPLVAQLKAIMSQARKKAEAAGNPPPAVENLRLPVRVEGAWRRSLQLDDGGWVTGTYHFVVARWSLLDNAGNTVTFGEKPLVSRPE